MSYKPLVLGGLFLTSALFLSGCDVEGTVEKTRENLENKIASISIPFEWFKSDAETVQLEIPDVIGVTLSEEKVDIDSLNVFSEKLSGISNRLEDKESFLAIAEGDKSLFNILGSGYLAMKYDETNDAFTQTIQEIGAVPYQWINSLTLRQYGIQLNDKGEREIHTIVDVNAVNDTEDFRIQTLQFVLNEDGVIQKATKVGKPSEKPHTNKPLNKDSILYADTHQEFQRDMEKVIQSLSNQTIYSQINLEEITEIDTSIKSLTKQIGVESKNESTIFDLVKHGKGKFSSWGITGYLYDDKNVNAKTFYELSVADEEGYHFYTVHYDRGLKEITNISKGSPFKEVIQ